MRIVHVVAHFVPHLGYEENCLPAAQAESGHQVTVVTSDRLPPLFGPSEHFQGRYPSRRVEDESGTYDGVKIERLSSTPHIYGQIALIGLRKRLLALKPDVVHVHGAMSPMAIQCILAQRSQQFKLFIDDHSHPLNFQVNKLHKTLYLKLIARAHALLGNAVASYVAITPDSRSILQTYLHIPASRIVEMRLAADTRLFRPRREERNTFRRQLRLPFEAFMIVSAGRFYRGKDTHVLVEAFSMVSRQHSECKLLMVGDSDQEYMDSIRALIRDLGLDNRVLLRGFVPHDELPRYYNAADIGVWPGGPSITVLEAIATSLPCVVSFNETYRNAIEREACVSFPRGDVSRLAEAISRLILSSELMSEVGLNGVRLIEDFYSWRTVSKRTIQLYRAESPSAEVPTRSEEM